ncbi:MAG: hypothetical protein FJ206_15005 [Gemmatimonadetes bacterium]|nr:hypothetical protein [Gemmatimonadota bacterium]
MTPRAVGLQAIFLLGVGAAAGSAQAPVRAGLVGSAKVGQPAPRVEGNLLAPGAAGGAGQAFRLSAELGRVVLLVFGPAGDRAAWEEYRPILDTAIAADVKVAIVRAGRADLEGFPRFSSVGVFPDSAGRVLRAFGARPSDWTFVLVDDAGRIAHRMAGKVPAAELAQSVAAAVRLARLALPRSD